MFFRTPAPPVRRRPEFRRPPTASLAALGWFSCVVVAISRRPGRLAQTVASDGLRAPEGMPWNLTRPKLRTPATGARPTPFQGVFRCSAALRAATRRSQTGATAMVEPDTNATAAGLANGPCPLLSSPAHATPRGEADHSCSRAPAAAAASRRTKDEKTSKKILFSKTKPIS